MTPPGGSGNRPGGEPPVDDVGDDDAAPGPGAGDGDLAAMRSVWLSMRDEEPSGRGMAELLAAARVKAEAMAPQPSRWQRWAAALRRPPVLALATVLVLLGGAVLVARRVHEDGPTPARAVPPETPAAETPRAGASAGAASSTPSGAPVGGSVIGRADTADDRAAPVTGSAGPDSARAATAAAPQAGRAPGPVPGGAGAVTRDLERDQVLRGGGGDRAEPPPPAAPARSRHDPPRDVGLVTRLGSASEGRRAPLVQQCEAAARRGDCPEVRRLIAQISQTDPGYRARVAQDAAFARCLE